MPLLLNGVVQSFKRARPLAETVEASLRAVDAQVDIAAVHLVRRSVDARSRTNIKLVHNVHVELAGGPAAERALAERCGAAARRWSGGRRKSNSGNKSARDGGGGTRTRPSAPPLDARFIEACDRDSVISGASGDRFFPHT